jgi:hypothetical protein
MTGGIGELERIYYSLNQWLMTQMWLLHGPPFTENSTKIPYKSMTVGTVRGEGANRTY